MPVKSLLLSYLKQLLCIVSKIPESLFGKALAPDMFNLSMNGKIAANFAVRGYQPLLQTHSSAPVFPQDNDKQALLNQINEIVTWLDAQSEVTELNEDVWVTEQAGEAEIILPQTQFIHQYIIPNFMFHMSMVYAIARANGVTMSKGDFDGIHQYSEQVNLVSSSK